MRVRATNVDEVFGSVGGIWSRVGRAELVALQFVLFLKQSFALDIRSVVFLQVSSLSLQAVGREMVADFRVHV